MNGLRLGGMLVAAIASLASLVGPDSDIPEADVCQSSTAMGVESLSILSGDGSTGAEISDYQVLSYTYGSQGGAMLPLRFEMTGSEVAACVAFELVLERCMDLDCQTVSPEETESQLLDLVTYEQGPTRVTRNYFWQVPEYVFVEGSLARLTVRVGAISKQYLIWIAIEGAFADAGMPVTGSLSTPDRAR